MTQDEYLAKYRPIFGGLLLEAAMSGKTGAEAYLLLRELWKKQEQMLAKGFLDLTQTPLPVSSSNGPAQQTPKGVTK